MPLPLIFWFYYKVVRAFLYFFNHKCSDFKGPSAIKVLVAINRKYTVPKEVRWQYHRYNTLSLSYGKSKQGERGVEHQTTSDLATLDNKATIWRSLQFLKKAMMDKNKIN